MNLLRLGDDRPEIEHLAPAAVLDDGGLWAAWCGCSAQTELLLVQHGSETLETVAEGRVLSPAIALAAEGPVVVWVSDEPGERESCLRWAARDGNGWSAPQTVPGSEGAVSVSLASSPKGESGGVIAAWCRRAGTGTYLIQMAELRGDRWTQAATAPGGPLLCQRSEVAAGQSTAWAAWDYYEPAQRRFKVAVAALDRADPQILSPADLPLVPHGWTTDEASQLCGSVAIDRAGMPWVACVALQDVATPDGVIDQWPTVRCARLLDGTWQAVLDPLGSPDLGLLGWGLLSRDEAPVWGYLGRRRRPLLIPDPDAGVWLVWERKEDHDGGTGVVGGALWGRRLTTEGVEMPVELCRGPRGYVPAGFTGTGKGRRLHFVARSAPGRPETRLWSAEVDVAAARPASLESPWNGWSPVALPLREPPRQQVSVRVDGEELHLYWADLHCHTGLSTDAEGELDELIIYARDKALLDCLLLQDNDFYFLGLTQSEYQLSRRWTDHHDQPGRFVLLLGYEWTDMGPRPGRANHRTVISGEEPLPLLLNTQVAEPERASAIGAHAAAHGALLHAHHPYWVLSDSDAETNLEVCSGWGVHFLDPALRDHFHQAVARRRLGFVGGSDNHRRNPGLGGALTGIYARELSRPALLAALRAHRCVATSGARIGLELWLLQEGRPTVFIGGTGRVQGAPRLRWGLRGAAAPVRMTLYRDGAGIATWETGGEQQGEVGDPRCPPGEHWYYLEAIQSGAWRHWPSNLAPARGPFAWTSPIWVQVE